MKSEELYRWVRTAGLLAVIPIILAGGPLGGYLIADLLIKKFTLPGYTAVICVILGFIASVQETIRIIKIALRTKER
ncbi:MAG: hypothetical protein NTY76_03535 [Candidatus Omnitrophica bacterium]|nr:hypothetical protein [Candidatus Omnitrophota bacterium]